MSVAADVASGSLNDQKLTMRLEQLRLRIKHSGSQSGSDVIVSRCEGETRENIPLSLLTAAQKTANNCRTLPTTSEASTAEPVQSCSLDDDEPAD